MRSSIRASGGSAINPSIDRHETGRSSGRAAHEQEQKHGELQSGKTRCRGCRDHPVEKSRPKRMGRYKRFATAVLINPSLADFCLQPSLKHVQLRVPSSLRDVVDGETNERFNNACRRHEDENGVVEVGILVATVNSVIDAAFARMPGGSGDDDWEIMDETTAMACTPFELARGAVLASAISAVEEAFYRELGVSENAVEGSSSSETHFARMWKSVLSEDSWSDVELSESGSEEDDDDWTMVDDNDVV